MSTAASFGCALFFLRLGLSRLVLVGHVRASVGWVRASVGRLWVLLRSSLGGGPSPSPPSSPSWPSWPSSPSWPSWPSWPSSPSWPSWPLAPSRPLAPSWPSWVTLQAGPTSLSSVPSSASSPCAPPPRPPRRGPTSVPASLRPVRMDPSRCGHGRPAGSASSRSCSPPSPVHPRGPPAGPPLPSRRPSTFLASCEPLHPPTPTPLSSASQPSLVARGLSPRPPPAPPPAPPPPGRPAPDQHLRPRRRNQSPHDAPPWRYLRGRTAQPERYTFAAWPLARQRPCRDAVQPQVPPRVSRGPVGRVGRLTGRGGARDFFDADVHRHADAAPRPSAPRSFEHVRRWTRTMAAAQHRGSVQAEDRGEPGNAAAATSAQTPPSAAWAPPQRCEQRTHVRARVRNADASSAHPATSPAAAAAVGTAAIKRTTIPRQRRRRRRAAMHVSARRGRGFFFPR